MVVLLLLVIFFLNPVRIFAATPQITNVVLNNSQNINLIESTTTTVSWTAVVTDADGAGNINTISGLLYRSGVANGASCTADDHNCYRLASEAFRTCTGNSCNVTFNAYVSYYADPTDATSAYASQYWVAKVTAADKNNNIGNASSPIDSVDIVSLSAVGSDNINIAYTTPVIPGSNTGSLGTQITIKNTGNIYTNGSFLGDDLCYDYPQCLSDKIPIGNIRVGLSADYASGTPLTYSPYSLGGLNTHATISPYIGFAVPLGKKAGTYSTQITFMANQPSKRPLGAMCTLTSDCETGSCLAFYRDADGDGLGQNTSVSFCSTGTPPWGYVTNNTDLDDSQYCPNAAYNPGTCQKCNSGAIVLQTASEDLFAQCNLSPSGCQADLCSGTSASCGYQPSSLVCRSSAGSCDIAESCTGSSYLCPVDSFQPVSYNPGGTCQKCTGSSATPMLQNSSEDLFGQCSTGVQGSITSCQSQTCAGDSASCGFLLAGTTCRNATSSCDTAESCSGTTYGCPSDSFVATGTRCTSTTWSGTCAKSGYSCTGNENGNYSMCDGSGNCLTGGSESRICNVASGTRCSDTGACSGQCSSTTGSCGANGGSCTGYYSTCSGTGLCNGSNSETIACTVPVGGICKTNSACWSSSWCISTYGSGYQYWTNYDDRCTAAGVCAQGENGACCDSCPLPYHSCTGYVVTDPATITCKAINYTCSSDAECCSGVCGTDADGDGYFSAAAGHTGTCQGVAKPYTDCSDTNINIYQNIANTITDNDQDGYSSGVAGTNCVGVAGTVSGRTYYKNASGSLTWLNNSQALGASDCNDSSSSYWQNRTCYYDGDNDGYRTAATATACVGINCTVSSSAYRRESTAPVDCDDTNASKKMCCWGLSAGSCNTWCNYSLLNCDGYYSGSGCTGTFHLCLGCAQCSTDGTGTCAAGGPAPGWNPWTYNSRYTNYAAPCVERPNANQCIVADGYPYDQTCVWNP